MRGSDYTHSERLIYVKRSSVDNNIYDVLMPDRHSIPIGIHVEEDRITVFTNHI